MSTPTFALPSPPLNLWPFMLLWSTCPDSPIHSSARADALSVLSEIIYTYIRFEGPKLLRPCPEVIFEF